MGQQAGGYRSAAGSHNKIDPEKRRSRFLNKANHQFPHIRRPAAPTAPFVIIESLQAGKADRSTGNRPSDSRKPPSGRQIAPARRNPVPAPGQSHPHFPQEGAHFFTNHLHSIHNHAKSIANQPIPTNLSSAKNSNPHKTKHFPIAGIFSLFVIIGSIQIEERFDSPKSPPIRSDRRQPITDN